MQLPLVSGGYIGRSTNIDSSRSINFFVELPKSQDSSTDAALVGTPGTLLWERIGSSPIRGMYRFGGYLFVVSGAGLYRIDSERNTTKIGDLNTNTGPLVFADNGVAALGVGGNQLLILDGTYGYIYDLLSNTVVQVPSENFPTPAIAAAYMDGYFIVSSGNMGITVSELYDGTTFNGLAIAAAISTPDTIKSIVNLHQQLFIIKEYSTEVWYNTGTATQDGCPFARINGAIIDYGSAAKNSVARGNNSIYFLANQRIGDGSGSMVGIVELNGYTPTVVSPPAIVYQISKFNKFDDAQGFCYIDEGHVFYEITFPSANSTFVYDATTQLWHERSTYSNQDNVVFDNGGIPTIKTANIVTTNRHLVSSYAFFAGLHLVGDYRTGNIYSMSSKYYTDNGEPIVSIRTVSPLLDKEENRKLYVDRITINAETGVGDDSVITSLVGQGFLADGSVVADGSVYAGSLEIEMGPGAIPQTLLSWSKDGGHTWSNNYPASLGKIGEYSKKLIWRRLGFAKDKVYRLTISSPVKKVILSTTVEVSL